MVGLQEAKGKYEVNTLLLLDKERKKIGLVWQFN